MATEWSNEKVITFLEILHTEPCLWDSRLKSFKNRLKQSDAWRRIMESLPFPTTIEELKKKKDSLMGYYRIHLNKIKKSLKSGTGKDDIYTTNWFAFATMDTFLREVYDSSRTLNTEGDNTRECSTSDQQFSVKCETVDSEISDCNKIQSTSSNSYSPGKAKRKNETVGDELSESEQDHFKRPRNLSEDRCDVFGKTVAMKLKTLDSNKVFIVEKLINDLLFEAEMGHLAPDHAYISMRDVLRQHLSVKHNRL